MAAVLALACVCVAVADDDPEPTREAVARELALARSCPNPFNANTEIVYTLLRPAHVKVDVYDLLGHHVVELLDEDQNAGENFAIWKTMSDPSGTYLYSIEVEGIRVFGKMSLVK
jgi:hypothetical protein